MKAKNDLSACFLGVLFLLITISALPVRAQYNDYEDDISLETFYEELEPYGIWIDDPQYGLVWRPDVDQDEFRPYYTRGHWEMTKYGNTWVSDYDWGWAPFHYGRWHHQSRRGWVWIPGRKWAPAWVSWRGGGGHYGWAPLGPGMNISINIGRIPNFWWVFVPQRYIYYRSYPRYDWRRNTNIYHNTVVINNIYVNNRNRYYTGPRADEIRKVTRQPVIVYPVRSQRPIYASGRNNRPEVNRGSVQTPRPTRPTDAGRGGFNGTTDNSIVDRSDKSNRGAVDGRSGNPVTERPNTPVEKGAVTSRPDRVTTTRAAGNPVSNRSGDQKLPASGQRSPRTYDNQDIRGSQAGERERQQVVERPSQPAPPQRGQGAARRPQQEQRSEPRPQQQERPQPQRESNRDNSRQESERASTPDRSSPERSSGGGRPPRGN
ncbi:MAG: DUF6600 domain-containing protein [Bacteroidota bacterium]